MTCHSTLVTVHVAPATEELGRRSFDLTLDNSSMKSCKRRSEKGDLIDATTSLLFFLHQDSSLWIEHKGGRFSMKIAAHSYKLAYNIIYWECIESVMYSAE